MYPFQLLFKNEFEAKTFTISDIIGHRDDHFSKLLESIFFPDYLTGLFLLEFYSINILGIIIATILWEGIRTYSSLIAKLD